MRDDDQREPLTEEQGRPILDWERVDEMHEPERIAEYLLRAASAGINADDKLACLQRLALSPGERFLELGCGVGGDVVAAAQRTGPSGVAVGVDRSRTLLDAATPASGAVYVGGDLHHLPFRDGTFDAIHCERTLQHVSRPVDAISDALRTLKPGGRAVFSEPDWHLDFWDHPMRDVTERVLAAQARRIRNANIGRRLTRLLVVAGFADVQTEVVPYHWLVTEPGAFATTLGYAVHDGAVTESESEAWAETLTDSAVDAPVLTGVIRFRVSGRRPR